MRNKIQEAKRRVSQREQTDSRCVFPQLPPFIFFFPEWKVLTPRAPYRHLILFTFVNRRKKERRKKGVEKGNEEEGRKEGKKEKEYIKR